MSTLAKAIGNKQWELAALCLLLGLGQMLSRLPADSVEGLIDILEGENPQKGRMRKRPLVRKNP